MYAVYKHPVNGDTMECEVLHSGGVVNNVPSLFSGDAYAQCKKHPRRAWLRAAGDDTSRAQRDDAGAGSRPAARADGDHDDD